MASGSSGREAMVNTGSLPWAWREMRGGIATTEGKAKRVVGMRSKINPPLDQGR